MSVFVDLGAEAVTAFGELQTAFAKFTTASLDCCTDAEVEQLTRDWETLRNQNTMVDVGLVGQLTNRGIPFARGCKNTAAYLKYVLRVSPGEARRRAVAAQRFGQVNCASMTVGPTYGPTAAALTAGAISAEHARVIADTVEKLPDQIAADCDEQVETVLLEHASRLDPHELAKAAQRVRYLFDQDGRYDDLASQDKTRHVRFTRRPDGTAHIDGDLTVEAAELLETAFDALAKPAAAADGAPDPRTPGQRRHDALAELARLAMKARLMPHTAGVTTTIILHMSPEAYVTGDGTATTGHGYTVPADVAKAWAERGAGQSEARIIAVLLSKTKRVEAYSSTHRIYTEQQRLAMMARDFGCSFPTCDSTALHTEAHHLVDYRYGGQTTIGNGTLLCGKHHRDFAQMGWTGVSIGGVPHWTPPAFIDADQKPIRKPHPQDDHGHRPPGDL